ncbi:hypothetical protein SB764_37335 [Paraburkholderia sp. SIMBA_027]
MPPKVVACAASAKPLAAASRPGSRAISGAMLTEQTTAQAR